MDGVDQLNNILIIGMTNKLDMINEALPASTVNIMYESMLTNIGKRYIHDVSLHWKF